MPRAYLIVSVTNLPDRPHFVTANMALLAGQAPIPTSLMRTPFADGLGWWFRSHYLSRGV